MNAPTTAPAAVSALPGVNVLLEGPAGTGKTHAIGTLVDTGIEVFFMAFEAGVESLYGYYTDKGKPIPANLHVHKIAAPSASFSQLADNAKMVNQLAFDSLIKASDPNKSKYDQFEKFLRIFNDVPDDRTGKTYGPADAFGTNKAIVIDGMTGLGNAVMRCVIGGKAARDQKDWGLSQQLLLALLQKLTNDCACHFVLIAHVERETDQVLGGSKITVSTLGKALAPVIPAMFSDVILTVRNGDKFVWDTSNSQADLKTRNLPISGTNVADFGTILAKWKSRGGTL